jgi:hypothetical protein
VSQQLVPPPWTGGQELWHSLSVVQEPHVPPPLLLPLLPPELLPLLLPLELPLELPLLLPLELPLLLPLELPLLLEEWPSEPPSLSSMPPSPNSSCVESPEPQAAARPPTMRTAITERADGSMLAP